MPSREPRTSVRDDIVNFHASVARQRGAHTHAYWFILSLLLRMARSYVANHHHAFYKKKMTSRFGFTYTYNIILQCLVRELLLSSEPTEMSTRRASRSSVFDQLYISTQPRTFLTSFYIIPHSRSLACSLSLWLVFKRIVRTYTTNDTQ